MFLFLLNVSAYVVKGITGFYIAIVLSIFLALGAHYYKKVAPLSYPKGKTKGFWLFSLIAWATFLYVITAHAPSNGSDTTVYYSLASLFQRGDFPMHIPWQPDYIHVHHIGTSEIFGAFRGLTGAPFYFTQNLLSFFLLLSWSQILTWIFVKEQKLSIKRFIIVCIPTFVGLLAMGGYILAWPTQFTLPHTEGNVFTWLGKLPTLELSYDQFGTSPTTLDAFTLFFHRLVTTSFLFGIVILLLCPAKIRWYTASGILIFLSSIALTDESVLFSILPAIFLVSLFTLFKKSWKFFFVFCTITILVIVFQGGVITETLLNRYHTKSEVLLFPHNGTESYTQYQTYRFEQDSSKLFEDQAQYQPLRWLHAGILWQLGILFVITLWKTKHNLDKENGLWKRLHILLWFFVLTSLTALIAYHGIVPEGLHHRNGNRFLALSYYLSGAGIAFFMSHWWLSTLHKRIAKMLLAWILVVSIVPPIFRLFPRPKDYWFTIKPETFRPAFVWVQKNIPLEKRILSLTDDKPIPYSNIDLVTQVGAYTPLWSDEYRSLDIFDTNPTYADLFYTLNPEMLRNLKINYLIVNPIYKKTLPEARQQDLDNPRYFTEVFSSGDEKIIEVQNYYFEEAKSLEGTLSELRNIAPKEGTYYIDYQSTTHNKNLLRSLLVALRDRDVHHYPIDYYNGRVDVTFPLNDTKLDRYDYLVFADYVDVNAFCSCKTEKIWEGTGDGIIVWKTHYE